MENMPEWLHSRPARRPAGPGAHERPEHAHTGSAPAPRPAPRSGRAGAVFGKAHYRTHALDHIRRQDDDGQQPDDAAPAPAVRQLPPIPIYGPADSAQLSPVPTALPTDRSGSVSSLRFFTGASRSPRALSPVLANAEGSIHIGARPATADPTKRERMSRRALHGALSPVSFSVDNGAVSARRPAEQTAKSPSRIRGRSTIDLDASVSSVGSMASGALIKAINASLPHSPRDDAAESVEDAIRALDGGHATRTMNLRGSLDRTEMHDIERLFEHIAVARTIQALNLSCNHFSDPMSWALERLLERNRSCLALRLGNNRMSDKMCSGVILALYKNTLSRVTEVYLGNNQAGPMTADALSRALRPGPGGLQNLKILNLSHNRLGDAGGALVVEALQNNLALRVLDLGSNDLAFKTKGALCRALKTNQALHEIRIERNPGLEDQGLVDILTTLRFSVQSELTMLYTVEHLGMFCMEADRSGRVTKHWDNLTVLQFLRDVRSWYGDLSKALFPISCEMWTSIHKNIQRVQKSLQIRALLGWHRLCFSRAASRARLKRHHLQVKKRPHFNLWFNTLTQRYLEPKFMEKCRKLHAKMILHYLTIWRLCRRHKSLFAPGTNWIWRINLPENAIQICQRAVGKAEFTHWFGAWSQYHLLWHTLSVRIRSKNWKQLGWIVCSWAAAAKHKRQRVQTLQVKRCKSTCSQVWKLWLALLDESRHQSSLMKRAGQRLTGMALAVAFSYWRERTDAAIVYRRKIGKAMKILGYAQIGNAMVSWKKIIEKKRRAEQNFRKSDYAVLKLLMKSTAWCTTHWRAVKTFKKRQRQKVKIGLLRLVSRSFTGWKPLRGRREDKELRETVIVYKYGMRRCKTLLRLFQWSASNAKRVRKVLAVLLHDHELHSKLEIFEIWRRESYGTHLHKMRHCHRLRLSVVMGWLKRIDRVKHVRRITAKLTRPRLYRMLLISCTGWKDVVAEARVHQQKVGRVICKVGKREEQEFFIAWIEAARSQIRRNARLRKGLHNLLDKYWHWFMRAVEKGRRERAAADLLFNFGEDRYLTWTFSSWHKTMLTEMRIRVLGAVTQGRAVKEAALCRLRCRLVSKITSQHWRAWARMTSVSRVWLRGYEAFRGLLKQAELADFCSKAARVDVPRLIERLSLDEDEETEACARQLFKRVLLHWHKLQSEGDLEYKRELQRFLAYLCEGWTAGEIPEQVSFGDIQVVDRGANLSVRRDDDGNMCINIPKVDTAAELRCRIQRSISKTLSPSFGSLLALPCPLLQAAHEFCRDFLCLPRGFLDCRGDHERWTEKQRKHVGEPSRMYMSPQGWVRVGLQVDEAVAAEHDIWSKWNVSFHAVRQEMVAQVISLDKAISLAFLFKCHVYSHILFAVLVVHSRMLLRPGDVGALGRTMQSVPGVLDYLGVATHKTKFVVVPQPDGPDNIEEYESQRGSHHAEAGAEEFQPSKHFLTSPSVIFTSQLAAATPVNWRGRKAQIVLQTRQRPDVSRILAFHDPMQATAVDEDYLDEELRWFTPAYGPAAIAVTGILFRFAD